MGNTSLGNPQPEIADDIMCPNNVLETPQEQNSYENTLEISGVKIYFESKMNADDNSEEWSHPFINVPSNEQLIKLCPVNNDQNMLKIMLLLEDVENDLSCDIFRKDLWKDTQIYNYNPQVECKSKKYEITSHQPRQIIDTDDLKECSKIKSEELVKTDNSFVENATVLNVEALTSTNTNSTLRYAKTTQTNLKETKNTYSQTDLIETTDTDSQTDFRKITHTDSQIDFRKITNTDSQIDLMETRHNDLQTDLRETIHAVSQTDLVETRHNGSQTDLKKTRHIVSQTDLAETKNDTQTNFMATRHKVSQTDLGEITHTVSQTDLTETRHDDSQTDLRETRHTISQTDLAKTTHTDFQTDLMETRHTDSQTDLMETRHTDSQTEIFATNLTFAFSPRAHTGSISPKAFKHCSVQCNKHQEEELVGADNYSLKSVSNCNAQIPISTETTSPLSCTTTSKRTTSTTSQTVLKGTRHGESQTETFTSDLPHSCQTQALSGNISPKVYSSYYVHCNEHNKDNLVNTSNSSMVTALMSTKRGLKEMIDDNSQTDMSPGIDTCIIHSKQTQIDNTSQTIQSCCIQKENIPKSEVNKQGFIESPGSAMHSFVSPNPHSLLSSTQELACEVGTQIEKDVILRIENEPTSHIGQYMNEATTMDFEMSIAAKEVYGEKISISTIKTNKENHFLHLKDSEKQNNSNLDVKAHKISLSRLKFPTVAEIGFLKQSHHPIFPRRIYKHTSLKKRINRRAPRRNTILTFSPKKSDAITSETVSLNPTSTQNKKEHFPKSSPTSNIKKHFLNPTSTKDDRNNFHHPTLIRDHRKSSMNRALTKEEKKYFPNPTPTKDVKKASLNHSLTKDDKKHPSSKSIEGEIKQSLIPILTTDVRKPLNPTSTRKVEIHPLNSSPFRGERKYSLNPTPTRDEKKFSLIPTLIRNDRKHSPSTISHDRKHSFSLKKVPVEEFIRAECIKGSSITEHALPIPLRISNLAFDWTAKSFPLLRKEPLELTISPAHIQFVESPTRDLRHFRPVNCVKINDDKQEISKGRSLLGSESLNSESVCTGESENVVETIMFRCKSHADSETNQHFVVCLCDDCYIKTQSTVEYFTNGGGTMPTADMLESKPLCIESSSSYDVGIEQENETSGETDVSESPSAKSLIENLYPLCEVVNDHLLRLKEVDEVLLKKSIKMLTERWLTVAADRYSRTKEVYNYLQYFHEFSDSLSKLILHSTDPEGNNALHFAYGNNRFDMAEELLNNKNGPDLLKKRNKLGHTPLMICAISQPETQEDWVTVRKSVKLGDINEVSPSSGQTALMNAASRGCSEMVRVLLDAGADPNQRDGDGSTALMYATEQGEEACVSMLLDHPECDHLLKDQDGQTASSIALGVGHKDIALLIYLQTKKIPYKAMQQAIKAHKRKNSSNKKYRR